MSDPSAVGNQVVSSGVLSWLKIVSFCVTSALAVIGFQGDFKDKHTKKLTVWGRVNLCGIAIAFIVGIAAQVKEDLDKHRADTELKGNLAKIIATNNNLLGTTSDAVNKLATVVKDNGTLITNTNLALGAAQKSELHTEMTLKDAERNLQAIGTSIGVDYEYKYRFRSSEDSALRAGVNNVVSDYGKKFPSYPPSKETYGKDGYLERCGFQINEELFTGSNDGCTVMFGAQSSILKSGYAGMLTSLTWSPPFSLDILDSKPPVPKSAAEVFAHRNDRIKPPQTLATYTYDLDQPSSASNLPIGIHSRPLFMFEEGASAILVSSDTLVKFRQNDLFNEVLSTIDLGGKYLRIRQQNDVAYVCRLTLQIGPRFFRVPMGDAERDMYGNYIYRFPKDMKETRADIERARSATDECNKEALTVVR